MGTNFLTESIEAKQRRTKTAAELYASRKRLIDEIKLSKGCVDCGYKEHPVALDFDHRDPNKKSGNISQMACGNWNTLLEEIDKCDIRCSNCHRIRTWAKKHYTKVGE